MLFQVILFVALTIFVSTLVYSTIDIVQRSDPRVRRKHTLQFGGLVLIYITTLMADVVPASKAFAEAWQIESSTGETLGAVIRTTAVALWIVGKTIFNTRQDPKHDRRLADRTVHWGIALTVAALLLVVSMFGILMYEVLNPPPVAAAAVESPVVGGTTAAFIGGAGVSYASVHALMTNSYIRALVGFFALMLGAVFL